MKSCVATMEPDLFDGDPACWREPEISPTEFLRRLEERAWGRGQPGYTEEDHSAVDLPKDRIYIYALVDPNSGLIRYIGKSERPRDRLAGHCNEQRRTHKANWIRGLVRRGQKPQLVILDCVPLDGDWQAAEREWIAYGHREEWPLTNSTSGGEGAPDLSPEARERIRTAWVGRKHRPESLAKIGDASRGRRHTAEWRENMRQRFEGRQVTWAEKISAAVRKLTDPQAEEIRVRLAAGERVQVLAREFGVHRTTISKIKMGTYPRSAT